MSKMKAFISAWFGMASLLVAGCIVNQDSAGLEGARDVGRAAQALSADEPVCITLQRGAGEAGVSDAVLWENAPL